MAEFTVSIIQRRLTNYRVPFFEALRHRLAEVGVSLRLLHGVGTAKENTKADGGKIEWAESLTTSYFIRDRLCWQPFARKVAGSDLLIVTQENALLVNHLLLLQPRKYKLAFWGHGANLQSRKPTGIKERYKRWTTNRVDWWFAYTQMSADLVTRTGFPGERITVLNNAVDTSELQRQRQSVTADETQSLRESLGFGSGPVGVFVGSLYADKRLDFLFAAAEAIRREVTDFQLLIVGEGDERDKVRAWCVCKPWARWVGAQFGREKVAHMSMAQLMLNPGLVGLGMLDAFVCGVPMLTTDCGLHSPEIAYLENNVNGLMTANDMKAYVDACVGLLRDERALGTLRAGCAASAREYTVEKMASRFADGIARCLNVHVT